LQTKGGKHAFDIFKIKAPLIGKITTELITARFARSFSILLSSGMDLATALDVTSVILGNNYLEEKFKEASEEVRRGVTLTNAFRKYELFPEMLIQMIMIAESTNTLEEVLGRSCAYFDEQVEVSLNNLTTKIEPIMLVIMGAVVGSLFLAVYSPMLSIMNGLNI
jgi:type IV pilus assembly protein PilC